MARLPFFGGEIRGQIIKVLLPKRMDEGEKDCLNMKTLLQRFKIIAQTVYLQVGENNSVHVDLVDVTIPDDVCDCLTEVSEDDELVFRVLQRYGSWEGDVPDWSWRNKNSCGFCQNNSAFGRRLLIIVLWIRKLMPVTPLSETNTKL